MKLFKMQSVLLIQSISVVFFSGIAHGVLIVQPTNVTLATGQKAYLNCSTNITSKEIQWYHGGNYVYADSHFFEPYASRFQIEKDANRGIYNLIIPSLEPGDAGEYKCQDDGGHGSQALALLIVLDLPVASGDSSSTVASGDSGSTVASGDSGPTVASGDSGPTVASGDSGSTVASGDSELMWLLLLLLVPCVLVAIVAVIYIYQRRKRNKTQKAEKTTEEITSCGKSDAKVDYINVPMSESKQPLLNQGKPEKDTQSGLSPAISQSDGVKITHNNGNRSQKPVTPLEDVTLFKNSESKADNNTDPLTESSTKPVDDAGSSQTKSQSEHVNVIHKEIDHTKTESRTLFQGKEIRGLGVLGETLFVLTVEPTALVGYDTGKYELSWRMPLKELVNPYDMAICNRSKSIYIIDATRKGEQKQMFDVNPLALNDKPNTWSTKDDFGHLTVTENGNILITVYWSSTILEYSAAGVLQRKIKLSTKLHPEHALKLTDDELLICFGRECDKDTEHEVCLIRVKNENERKHKWTVIENLSEKEVVKSFGKKEKSTDCDSALIPLLCVHG